MGCYTSGVSSILSTVNVHLGRLILSMVTPLLQDKAGYSFRALNFLLALAEFVAETITSCLQRREFPLELCATTSNEKGMIQQARDKAILCACVLRNAFILSVL
jgi:hypothetical protein